MPIYKIEDGKKYSIDYGRINGIRKIKRFDGTEKQAEEELKKQSVLMKSAKYVNPAVAPRIDDAADAWVERQRRRLVEEFDGPMIEEMEFQIKVRNVQRHFCDLIWQGKRLGERKTTDLTVEIFEDELLPLLRKRKSTRTGRGVQSSTVKAGLVNIKMFLKYCVKMRWVENDPSEYVKISVKIEKSTKNVRRISPLEMQQIIAAAPDKYHKEIMFAAYTGLRAGEQVALRWDNVDLDDGIVNVVEAKKAIGGVSRPKTPAAERRVSLEIAVLKMLREWKLRQPLDQRSRGLVFPSRTGNLANHAHWRNRGLSVACEIVGVERCTWHDLRHFYASVLIFKTDLNDAVITEYMGHSDIKVTQKFYARWFKDADTEKEIAEKLTTAFGTGEGA